MTTSGGETPTTGRDRGGIVLLLVFAGALRLYAWDRTHAIFNDGPVFLEMAQAMLDGRWSAVFAHPYHPLYPALTALVSLWTMDLVRAAVWVSVLGGLMSIVGIFLLVRRLFDREIAWLSAWLVALHPWAVDFSSDVMSDGLYAGFFLLGLAALVHVQERPSLAGAMGVGLFAGLAYLVRPEGLGLAVVATIVLCLSAARAERRASARASLARTLLAMTITLALLAAPFVYLVATETGDWAISRKKNLSGLVQGAPGFVVPVESAAGGIALPRSSERASGGGAQKPPRNLAGVWESVDRAGRTSLAALRYEVALFVLFGWASLGFRRPGVRGQTLLLPAVLYSGVLVLLVWGAGYVARRHALTALLPLVAYAAVAWRAIYQGFLKLLFEDAGEVSRRDGQTRWLCLGLVLVLAVVWGGRDLRVRRADRLAVRSAAEWLQEAGTGGRSVAAQKLRVAYYAGAPFFPLPSGNAQPLESHLRAHGVGWVVIDEAHLTDHRGLLEGVGSWLRVAHSVDLAGHRALVMEVHPGPASGAKMGQASGP